MIKVNELTVTVGYYNSATEKIEERTYTLSRYTNIIKSNLIGVLGKIEKTINDLVDAGPHEAKVLAAKNFAELRHNILDNANAIERLPENMRLNNLPVNSMKASDFIAGIINAAGKIEH